MTICIVLLVVAWDEATYNGELHGAVIKGVSFSTW